MIGTNTMHKVAPEMEQAFYRDHLEAAGIRL